MKKAILFTLLIFLFNCEKSSNSEIKNEANKSSAVLETPSSIKINEDKNTVKERFPAPEGYSWVEVRPNSFGHYLENFALKKYSSPILKYNGTEIETQHLHEAIFVIDTGTKDLQQCADALIRLRAEYLFQLKKFDEIKFHFTSGDLMTWNDYKKGTRAFVNGNSVKFKKTENFDDSKENFRKYLDLIFTYAGTISLNKETKPVLKTNDLKTGDLLITAGSPGHIVFIAGVSENQKGQKLFLLAEGFTPAQSIHLLKNPFNPKISPWYELDVNSAETKTARYFFEPSNFRSF
ncbi:DUF4846 domain-containing protein [Kaistella antarctica]|uniref:DUF4846 domain-containing protein n=1 Tax=Kaistella antarctica TaxID=266748 RepID=A0A3S5EUY0_9FLAO|nr:DUF4846 domain-containing protein [Kaistella antarctica]KEY18351.1 hypothetical protein HY04_07485 [Kaistella antarctica]SEV84904.1 protein of unknown function (4846) [Kaistella antarctica]VEI01040.1 Uncharacterised protein [Kaistella antarctica]